MTLPGLYKRVKKKHIAQHGDVLEREEDSDDGYGSFSLREVSRIYNENVVTGKMMRVRRAFFVASETGRVYKIAVDLNTVYPRLNGRYFSQLEIEYSGIGPDHIRDVEDDSIKVIIHEIQRLHDLVKQMMDDHSIRYDSGHRKVDILKKGVE